MELIGTQSKVSRRLRQYELERTGQLLACRKKMLLTGCEQ